MNKRYWPVLIIFFVVIAFLMAACSNPATTAPQAPAISTSSAPVTTSNAPVITTKAPIATAAPVATTSAPTSTAAVKKGGTLKIGVPSESTALGRPEVGSTAIDGYLSGPCLENLRKLDAKGGYSPWLADSWTTDPQAATITIKLKKGAKFHDGTTLDATAVKWNYDWLIPQKSTSVASVKSVDIVDDYTFRINLTNWYADALYDVTGIWIVSPTSWKDKGDAWGKQNPVGTGPFKFVSHQIDANIKYIAFSDYWGTKPNLAGVEFAMIKDPTTRFTSFQAGEIDVDMDPSIVQVQQVQNNPAIVFYHGSGFASANVLLGDGKNADSPFAKVQVRQALSYALNRDSLVKNILGGYGIASNQIYPPGTWPNNPNIKATFDTAKAKQLLADAGYAGGFDTTLTCTNVGFDPAMATAIQAMLADVGIRASLNSVAMAAYLQASSNGWKGLLYGGMPPDPNRVGWAGNFAWKTASSKYVSGFKSPEIDALIDKANVAPDQATRQPLVWNLMEMLINQNAQYSAAIISDTLLLKYAYVQDLNLYGCPSMGEWHAETAWLNR
jgi:peptide/nickel transport system substrate-binding protein